MAERDRSRPPAAVAFRRVERALGQADSAYCPRRDRTTALGECRQCEHWNGVCVDAADGEAFVRCAWSHDRAAPRAGTDTSAALATIMLDAQQAAETRVRQVMNDYAFTLHCEADLSRAAALMAYEGVHHIIVCGPDGRPAGIVSSIDILRWLARDHGYLMPENE